MQWTKPDFQDIPLAMEVTAYVNTDDIQPPEAGPGRSEESSSAAAVPCETTA
jgi:coenzyme PQQ precursor peptide PqqA